MEYHLLNLLLLYGAVFLKRVPQVSTLVQTESVLECLHRVSLAVNISGMSVDNAEYAKQLHALLDADSWLKHFMLFEITESARVADLKKANAFVQGLRGKGFHVCLDDFGAGAASFQYLSVLEVDVVKLDGSAVKNAQAEIGRAHV